MQIPTHLIGPVSVMEVNWFTEHDAEFDPCCFFLRIHDFLSRRGELAQRLSVTESFFKD